MGRWLNRDPLGEPGFEVLRRNRPSLRGDGPNSYHFVGNNPISNVDHLGLIKVCIRPLRMCKFTMAIVHCFLDMEDGTTYSYDNKGIHADPDPNSKKKKCADISPSTITADDIKKQADADKAGGKWDGSDYGFTGHNCCQWVDQVLTSLGSKGVASYFPGYTCQKPK